MLIILGLLVCCAVIYSARQTLHRGIGSASAIVAALCSVGLSIAFLFFLDAILDPAPVLKALHTDLTGAMVVGAVAMASAAVISGCAAFACIVRKVEGWTKVFFLLAVACTGQGCAMFYLLLLH
jgi:hypothetical protein